MPSEAFGGGKGNSARNHLPLWQVQSDAEFRLLTGLLHARFERNSPHLNEGDLPLSKSCRRVSDKFTQLFNVRLKPGFINDVC
ncbi:hypothetical protein Plim_1176 [Planctopirus limnophila DSM 3776]|uniref:Uncharacterized protein n=1 Tax=Planctopirus limnophila (strain ATCC 43296 / DSM 3776 / IFAM 1008 / Mu 290) TaxID=521674 RepID=D5SU26_PLAL2|nr:hypothetical protein Plim_1176 [Planctopirus limnophila DSM 3776]